MNLKLIYGFKMTKINLLITAPLEFTLGLQEKIKTETNLFYLYDILIAFESNPDWLQLMGNNA